MENVYLPVGATLGNGKYRIVRFIGAGGFGCTYEAEYPSMGIRVAIKEFYIADFCDRDATGAVSVVSKTKVGLVEKLREKFVREVLNIARLRHPNIVRVSERFDENGTSYYVMDYIDGQSLMNLIDEEGPLPQDRALRYIGQVMDALETVHDANMLHLDIKPDNIIIDAKDDAILIDFGVSKQYDEIDGHNTSTIMGQTPGYAPPEQAGNCIRQFTPAADIYALGATLYTALTGTVPPSSTDIVSGFASLAPLADDASPALQQAITLMMQPNASQRPQTIAAVRDLLKTENEAPVPLTPPITPNSHETAPLAAPHETKPIETKPKKWLWAAVAAAVVAIGVTAILFTRGKPAEQEETIAQADKTEIADTTSIAKETEPTEDPISQVAPIPEPVQDTPVIQPVTQSNAISGTEEDYEWVDMGTSVKWATTNIGANSPQGHGIYLAWGETYISPDKDYSKENCRLYGNSSIVNIAGNKDFDMARSLWDGKWRMPTKEEFQELIDKCEWTWYGGGYEVKSKTTGNVIYLPAAGRNANRVFGSGEDGDYWSASADKDSTYAWYLDFDSGRKEMSRNVRNLGTPIRPVMD